MKKILLIAALAVFTLTGFGQTYSFESLVASDFTNLSSNGTLGSYTMDGVAGPAISYTATDYMTFTVKGVNFRYKNSANKANIIKTGTAFLQTDGKNVEILLTGLSVGDKIQLNVSAKGSTNSVFEVTGGTVNSPAEATSTGISNAAYVDVVITVGASEVTIKETAGGYRIKSLTVTKTASVKTTFAEKGVQFKGSVLLNDNNMTLKVFNVLGKQVEKSNASIDMAKFQKGIYLVYAEGLNEAMKIRN
ncbi:MAG: hypothetical protein QM751_15915 [Paludibacteraceae bacterium]